MHAGTDWGTAVVVDPRWLSALRSTNTTLRRTGAALAGAAALGAT